MPAEEPARAPGWHDLVLAAVAAVLLALALRVAPAEATLVVDGRAQAVVTRAGTVGALLTERGVILRPGDLVTPGPAAHLRRGARVEVRHAVKARVHADGRVVRAASLGRSARAVLVDAGVTLSARDRVSVNGLPQAVDAPLSAASVTHHVGRDRRPESVLVADARRENAIPPLPAPAQPQSGPLPPDLAGALGAIQPETLSDLDPRLGTDDDLVIAVWRARPIVVEEDGVALGIELAGATVGEALVDGGIPLWPEDVLAPPADAPLSGVQRIRIRRATPFVVLSDNASRDVRAWASTVGEGLARGGIGLQGHDYSVPPAETALSPGMVVQIVRVREDVMVIETDIPYGVETEPDAGLTLDQTRVIQAGVPGMKEQRIRITYEDGLEIDRQVEEEIVLREPVTERVAYGTNIVWGTVDTPDGPKRYWRQLRVYATSYSAARAGTPKSAPWYGRTRLGLQMRKGIVAVDPRLIPLGTNLYVPGFGVGLAGDTGGGIRNYHIDLGFDDDNYESWHWSVDLYLLEPLPPERSMRWILP